MEKNNQLLFSFLIKKLKNFFFKPTLLEYPLNFMKKPNIQYGKVIRYFESSAPFSHMRNGSHHGAYLHVRGGRSTQ